MIRSPLIVIGLLASSAFVAACKPGAPATPGGDSPSASATSPAAANGPGAPAAGSSSSVPPSLARPRPPPQMGSPGMPPPVPEPVSIDDKIVERYIAFDKRYLSNLPQRMQAMRDELRKIEVAQRNAGAAGGAGAANAARGVLDTMKSEDARLRAEAGLTEAQAQTMQELAMALSAAKTRKVDLADTRKRFGDGSVNIALRHEAELVPLWDAHMKVFQDAMKLMMQK